MFCSQCGTSFEPGQNFCKHCGARVNKQQPDLFPASEPSQRGTIHTAPSGRASSARPHPRSRERKEIGLTVLTGVCLTVIVVGGAVYFGTDLFRQPAEQKTIAVASLPAVKNPTLPQNQEREEKNKSNAAVNDSLPSAERSTGAKTSFPRLPDSSRSSAEASPKPAAKTDETESARKSLTPRAGEDAQASGRNATKPPAKARVAAGTYQTTRSTTVFESASSSSQVVANIPGGTRLDVVNAKGEWLEVHSRRGNPPGFIRREDAALIDKTE